MSGIGRLAGTPVISIAGMALLPALAGLLAGTGAGAGKAGRAVPSPGVSSSLQGVACTSARNCWAVGSYETPSAQLNEALHWNGTRWSRVATPDHGTGAGAHSSLAAVSCTSAGNCWAVGSYESGTISLNQALLWNGTRWSRVATPDPGDTAGGAYSLSGVSCVSRADCWAVGSHISDRRIGRNAALHWNGKNWSAVDIPSPGKNVVGDGRRLAGIACLPAGDCWAVGGYVGNAGAERSEILHWNGTRWQQVAAGAGAAGGGALTGVACPSAASCWAVKGQASTRGALHWNGMRWSAVATPGGGELNGVACASAASCRSAGNYDAPGALLNEVLSWNGTSWSGSAVPDPGAQNRLAAVACPSEARCWAVGSYWDSGAGALRNVILRWNGRAWSS